MAAILPSEEILCNNLKKFPPYGIAEYALHGADIGRFFAGWIQNCKTMVKVQSCSLRVVAYG